MDTIAPSILIVEDEADILNLMSLHLSREGYTVTTATTGETGRELLRKNIYNVAVLDWMLPGVSGLTLCKEINGRVPVLMVTARANPADIVLALEMGAEDYVVKPFDLSVFLARVRALLRRGQRGRGSEALFRIGALEVSVPEHRVLCSGTPIQLTVSEFRLLTSLLENRGRVLPRDVLVKMVQGPNISVTERTIDTHIFGLRKKLGSCADVIETIRGVGYRVSSE